MAKSTGQDHRFDFTDTITVIVGPKWTEKRFTLHKDVICSRSTFFRAAVLGKFKEGKDKVVRLPDLETDPFSTYVQWAYSGNVVIIPDDESNGFQTARQYIQLYMIADVLGDTLLRNKITDLLSSTYEETGMGPAAPHISYIYESTPEKSKLRKLVLDWHLIHVAAEWLESERELLPAAFLADLAIEWARAKLDRGTLLAAGADKCRYHDHDEQVPICT